MRDLLDTNVCVEHLRGRASNEFNNRLAVEKAQNQLVLCSIVKAELLFGAVVSGNSQRNVGETLTFLSSFVSLSFNDGAAAEYAQLKARLTSSGTLIGPNDLMIAAIALQHGLTLVTHNVGEFSRVPGLQIEDWQTP